VKDESPSFMFKYLTRRKGRVRVGGIGAKRPSKILRVPLDTCSELDALIDSWRRRVESSSPRYDKAKVLLADLEEIIMHGSDY
jgi:hypothetical protein